MKRQGETIAAIATANGAGGIGIVRLSGSGVLEIGTRMLGRTPAPRHAHFCTFRDHGGRALDYGLLLYFPAPHSFTGEDVLELQAHGSPVMLRCLLDRMIELGARQARAGEFSERAFINGRIDLAQAEAIADLIASGSEVAARAAVRSLEGEFSRQVTALTEAVIKLRFWIEAAIDFPEEEIDFLSTPTIIADFNQLAKTLNELLTACRRGVRLADGLHVVIVGRPNAGKSSLLNALAASDRAIVTEVPGTTRDVLRETIDLDGIAITLVDTAGLRESDDIVEREGIRRARSELEHADLAILVSSDEHVAADLVLLGSLPASTARIVVHNKIDIDSIAARSELVAGQLNLWLSARTGSGIELLALALREAAGHTEGTEGAYTARARHVDALERAHAHLESARHALCDQRAGELAAEELRQIQDVLGEITGRFSSDDLLGRIFSGFCIGK
jgi:tRNA modification GTPase